MVYGFVTPSRATVAAKLEGGVCERFRAGSQGYLGLSFQQGGGVCGWGLFSIEGSGSILIK